MLSLAGSWRKRTVFHLKKVKMGVMPCVLTLELCWCRVFLVGKRADLQPLEILRCGLLRLPRERWKDEHGQTECLGFNLTSTALIPSLLFTTVSSRSKEHVDKPRVRNAAASKQEPTVAHALHTMCILATRISFQNMLWMIVWMGGVAVITRVF